MVHSPWLVPFLYVVYLNLERLMTVNRRRRIKRLALDYFGNHTLGHGECDLPCL